MLCTEAAKRIADIVTHKEQMIWPAPNAMTAECKSQHRMKWASRKSGTDETREVGRSKIKDDIDRRGNVGRNEGNKYVTETNRA